MRRVVGHNGRLSTGLLSLAGAGVTGGGASQGGDGTFLVGRKSPADIPGYSTSIGKLAGVAIVGSRMVVAPDDSGKPIYVFDMQNWDDWSDPANSVVSMATSPQDGKKITVSADGLYLAFLGAGSGTDLYQMSTPWDVTTLTQIWSPSRSRHRAFAPDGSYTLQHDSPTVGSDAFLGKWNVATPWDFSGIDLNTPDEIINLPGGGGNNGGRGLFMPSDTEIVIFHNTSVSGYDAATYHLAAPGDFTGITFRGVRMQSEAGQFAYFPGGLLSIGDNETTFIEHR